MEQSATKQNEDKTTNEEQLKMELYRIKFYLEFIGDLISYQKRDEKQPLGKTLLVMKEAIEKMKKSREETEARNDSNESK